MIEVLPAGWHTLKITLQKRDRVEERYEIYHEKTHFRYLHESLLILRVKCLALFTLGVLTYFLIQMGFRLARLGGAICHLRFYQAVDEIYEVGRIFIYWIAMEFAALYGIFSPLDGRASFSQLEREYQGKDRKRDFNWLDVEICAEEAEYIPLAAPCFQPYGTTDSPNVVKYSYVDQILQDA